MADSAIDRLDYEQTLGQIRVLTDNRFKLLALVPTLAGAGIGLLSRNPAAGTLLAVGIVALAATVGVFVYEVRNGQLHRRAIRRARTLEEAIGFRDGGLFREPSEGPPRWHGSVALVYGAALGGWVYVVIWGLLIELEVGGARWISGLVGAAAGFAMAGAYYRLHSSEH